MSSNKSAADAPRSPAVSRCAAIVSLLMLTFASPTLAADLSGSVLPPIRTIVVDGHGEVRAKPDTASLSVAIETHAATAEQCAQLNAALADKVAAALKSKLGDKGRIETGGYSLSAEYNQRPGRDKPAIVGYRAENSITVETSATDLLGPLIDAAIASGANRIDSINFTLKDDTAARGEALAMASRDAQAQAKALAASLGVKLKRIYEATTEATVRPIQPVFAESAVAASMAARVPTPIPPGEIAVPAQVSLVYEIE